MDVESSLSINEFLFVGSYIYVYVYMDELCSVCLVNRLNLKMDENEIIKDARWLIFVFILSEEREVGYLIFLLGG